MLWHSHRAYKNKLPHAAHQDHAIPHAATGTPSDRATLAEPLSGSLLFAGEATDLEAPSTLHGAYASGLRAAQRVLDSVALASQVCTAPCLAG